MSSFKADAFCFASVIEHCITSSAEMATITMSRPHVSSPLADASHSRQVATQRIIPQRTASFPTSRALRPFPTVSHALRPTPGMKPPVKIIEPPKNYKGTFLLDLTQAEFSRQD